MEFGCCITTLDQVAALEAARADFYELPAARLVMASADAGEFDRLARQAAGFRLRPRAYNVLLPAELKVVGPEAEPAEIERYLRVAFDRMRRLGGHVVVFGSGRSRSLPDSIGRAAGLDQLEWVLRLAGELAHDHGMVLALEPLRREESNVFNTLLESAAFIRERQLARVRLLADLYHMLAEDEPFSALHSCAELLVHAHVAERDRQPPGYGDADLSGFCHALRDAGYRGDCSIEARWTDFARQLAPSLDALRGAAHAAGW